MGQRQLQVIEGGKSKEERKQRDAELARMAAKLAAASVEVLPAADMGTPRRPISYVLGKRGLYLQKQTRIGFVLAEVLTWKADLVGVEALDPLWDPPAELAKIPWDLYAKGLSFLKWVRDEHKSEGLFRVYLDGEGKWHLHVPNQKVTGASVKVPESEPDPGLGLMVLEQHSHPGSSSSFSGVDDADDREERVYGCVAGLDKGDVNFHFRVGTGTNAWVDIEIEDIIEMEEEVTLRVPRWKLFRMMTGTVVSGFLNHEFPEEWKERVKEDYRVPPGSSHHGQRGHGGWSPSYLHGAGAQRPAGSWGQEKKGGSYLGKEFEELEDFFGADERLPNEATRIWRGEE